MTDSNVLEFTPGRRKRQPRTAAPILPNGEPDAMAPDVEAFCVAIACEGMSQSDAYRQAFPRSSSWTDRSIHVAASKLAADANVAMRITALRRGKARAAHRDGASLRDEILRNLWDIADHADRAADRIKALDLLARFHGLYDEKPKPAHTDLESMSAAEVEARLEQRLRELAGV